MPQRQDLFRLQNREIISTHLFEKLKSPSDLVDIFVDGAMTSMSLNLLEGTGARPLRRTEVIGESLVRIRLPVFLTL